MEIRTVVIGGAGGIGSAIVKAFVEDGHFVFVADIDVKRGDALLREYNGRVSFIETDVLNIDSIISLEDKISQKHESIEHVVSLAGGALKGEFFGLQNIGFNDIEKSIDLNLTSHIVLINKLLSLLKKSNHHDKSITFISSVNAKMDFGLPAYSAAKAGLIGLTKVLAAELGVYGIRVNVVLPGTVVTTRTLNEPKLFDEYQKGSLLGRFASEKEIADVVLYLSTKLSCITGQEIIADCGQTVRGVYKNK